MLRQLSQGHTGIISRGNSRRLSDPAAGFLIQQLGSDPCLRQAPVLVR
jgi:hypothetical protein